MPSVSGGGVSPIVVARKTVSDAVIKTMSSPAVVVPPTQILNYVGSVSVFFVPVRAIAVINTAAGAYSATAAMGMALCWGSDESIDIATGEFGGSSTVTSAFGTTSPNNLVDFPATALQATHLDGNLHDNGIYVFWNGGSDPLTGGAAANTLTVTVAYQSFVP